MEQGLRAASSTSVNGSARLGGEVRAVPLIGPSGTDVPATVAVSGSGRSIVFLHGLVGLNEHWEGVVETISQHARCLMLQIPLLDLRGPDCSIGGATEMTIRFLEDHVGEPAMLVGNSFGGHVALRIALERPDLVFGMVLTGSSGLIEKSMVKEVQLRPSRDWLSQKIGELFFDRSVMRDEDLDRAHKELSERGSARAMIRLSRTARRNHLGDRITQIGVPTLLVWGKDDVVTPPAAAVEFQRLLPNARIVWFDRCGHVPMMEHPGLFSEAVVGFLDELQQAGRVAG